MAEDFRTGVGDTNAGDRADALVLGLDIGATSTRALLATAAGERLGTGQAGGGNPNAHGPGPAASALLKAVRGALAGVDPARVRAAVLGLAGGHRLVTDPVTRSTYDRAWRSAGLDCPYSVVSDALIAYAAGTAQPTGTVLVAGTGAVAAAVCGHELDRVADGHGWLLGDLGSGFWLGREAVRTTLSDLDRWSRPGPLATLVLTDVLGSAKVAPRPRTTAANLVQTLNTGPPIALAALAPLVMRAHAVGDPAAVDVVHRAADHLVDAVRTVRAPRAQTPIVLAGGVLTAATPVMDELRGRLAERWPEAPVVTAGDGAAAAAWLAARPIPGVDAAAVHARLVG